MCCSIVCNGTEFLFWLCIVWWSPYMCLACLVHRSTPLHLVYFYCRCEWQTLLDTVKCEIVSCSGSEAMDAYILRFVNVVLIILTTDVQASVSPCSLGCTVCTVASTHTVYFLSMSVSAGISAHGRCPQVCINFVQFVNMSKSTCFKITVCVV